MSGDFELGKERESKILEAFQDLCGAIIVEVEISRGCVRGFNVRTPNWAQTASIVIHLPSETA